MDAHVLPQVELLSVRNKEATLDETVFFGDSTEVARAAPNGLDIVLTVVYVGLGGLI
jgi:hypothetical protein